LDLEACQGQLLAAKRPFARMSALWGISRSMGALMLSVLLGTAFLSRQVWGVISDRIGGLATVLIGSAWQAASMTAFLLTQNEVGLSADTE
jgi:nitrate/nitrite transporter NarK